MTETTIKSPGSCILYTVFQPGGVESELVEVVLEHAVHQSAVLSLPQRLVIIIIIIIIVIIIIIILLTWSTNSFVFLGMLSLMFCAVSGVEAVSRLSNCAVLFRIFIFSVPPIVTENRADDYNEC